MTGQVPGEMRIDFRGDREIVPAETRVQRKTPLERAAARQVIVDHLASVGVRDPQPTARISLVGDAQGDRVIIDVVVQVDVEIDPGVTSDAAAKLPEEPVRSEDGEVVLAVVAPEL